MVHEKSLLVVDDERSFVDLVSRVLRREGYGVLHGKDGIDAFSSLFLHSPSLMLIDLCLPCITGLEVIEQVRGDQKTADVPIVAMSGDPSLLERAIAMGADAILAKPFSHEALKSVVARHLGEARTQDPPIGCESPS
ncbi:response regulator [Pendulispora albinea]|uniref:Response regulator n=1 Tax=Pendulispora albinea TaxID=2741071 RepID=A0ABZ2LTT8_9BACT